MIDSTDVRLKQPLSQLPAYTNRKFVTSVKLQVVCDWSKKFIDISAGWPGSMHDARIFEMSSLSGVLEQRLEGTEFHLLGDSAYPGTIRLLKPYNDNGFLTPVRKAISLIVLKIINESFYRYKLIIIANIVPREAK